MIDEMCLKALSDLALCKSDIYGHLMRAEYGLTEEQINKIYKYIGDRLADYTCTVLNGVTENMMKLIENPPL
jgi:hypothetical protein